LYVLASESRLLLSKDVDTNEFCYVPIEITLKASQHHNVFKYQQMAPCILPELNRIQELQVLGPRYYPIKFKENIHFKDLKFILNSELFVKQKMAISVIRTILKMRKHLILGIFSTK
jgi:anaphase-promoting complex subunit 1